MMISPRLDTPVEIQRRTTAQDPAGGPSDDFVAFVPRIFVEWQDALPGRSEAIRAGVETSRNTARVRLRYLQGLDSGMRVVRDGVIYNIIGGPAEIGRREWQEIVVERYGTMGGDSA